MMSITMKNGDTIRCGNEAFAECGHGGKYLVVPGADGRILLYRTSEMASMDYMEDGGGCHF